MTSVTGTPTFSLPYLEAVHDVQHQIGVSCPYKFTMSLHTFTLPKVAALSVLVWDLLLTLEEEVEYVWP